MASSPGSVVTIGGKGSSLSPAAVYAISRCLSAARIDSAALDKLSSQSKRPSNPKPEASSSSTSPSTSPRLLTSEESRAALVVLLNKLLLSDVAIRPALPVLIEKTLTLASGHEVVDFGSAHGLLSSLCQLNDQKADEVGIGRDEIAVLEGSCAALGAICAILDCGFSALVKVADAVAALSCEATRADISAFDSFSSGDGFSNKDEMDVASDLKMLLFGSKLVGQKDLVAFREVPTVSGRFRKAVKWLHDQTRVELNSVVKAKKATSAGNLAKEEDFVDSIMPLVMSIRSMSKSSIGRAKSTIEAHGDADRRSKIAELFEKECPSLDALMEQLLSVTDKALSGSDDIAVLQGVYQLLVKLREVLSWEAAVALFAIEMDDSIEKPQAEHMKPNGEASKVDKKSEKKKKKTLGKGTSIIWQLLTNRTASKHVPSTENVTYIIDWAKELSDYFDPRDIGFDAFLTKMKEIVESNEVRRLPKIPKGTRDFGKEQMAIRELAFSIITGVFKMHGAVALDTPVFELRETLMGKYGEDSKLIYDLADQGGELCSLRYDLTVPFARYLAMNGITSLKRYQIAKVYRRDNPSKGRYREFYQCDFDIAGNYEPMEPDFEVLTVLNQLLDRLNIGIYEIKLNHRKLLDGMLEICGVSSEKFRTVCSSIDKLDKQSFEQIRKELIEEKGLASETADKIGTLVKKRGPPLEILMELKSEGSPFLQSSGSVIALNELEILFKALEKANCLDKVVFDLSLARGLDYYTGVIFEAVFKGTTQVGSIAAGGRYDNLVGMFSGKQVPAVGVSLGIERVFAIMEQLERNQGIRATETEVLVAILAKDLQLAAPILDELWRANIKAEFGLTKRVMTHITRAIDSGIPFMVIVGESEVQSGIFRLKNIKDNIEEEVPRDRFIEVLKERLNSLR